MADAETPARPQVYIYTSPHGYPADRVSDFYANFLILCDFYENEDSHKIDFFLQKFWGLAGFKKNKTYIGSENMNLPEVKRGARGPAKQPLTAKMKEAAHLSADGKSMRQIAEQLGVSAMTVSRWFDRDDLAALRHRLIERRVDDAVGRAMRELIDEMDNDNHWIRQNASRELARIYREQRKDASENAGIAVVFENMPIPGAPESAEQPGGGADDYEEVIESEFTEA